MTDVWLLILLCGVLTYLTRIGGHVVLTRFGTIPPRLEAALDAVPAAVLTTIVAPVLITGDWPERIAILLCALLSLRLPLILVVFLGVAFVAGARALGF
ncbi:MAG: AzlD domain-containing protein [Rhizobiaceae bacterium]|nr:AzlD domain-containing protein [Rhizobiaceae bacterium]